MNEIMKIYDVIEKESKIIEALISIMKIKQEAIIALKLDDLKIAVNEEINLVSRTKSLEKERIELIKKIIPDGNQPDDVRFSEIMKKGSSKENNKLSELRENLRLSLEEMKHLNETNALLIERSKKFIKENIQILTRNGEKQLVNFKI